MSGVAVQREEMTHFTNHHFCCELQEICFLCGLAAALGFMGQQLCGFNHQQSVACRVYYVSIHGGFPTRGQYTSIPYLTTVTKEHHQLKFNLNPFQSSSRNRSCYITHQGTYLEVLNNSISFLCLTGQKNCMYKIFREIIKFS